MGNSMRKGKKGAKKGKGAAKQAAGAAAAAPAPAPAPAAAPAAAVEETKHPELHSAESEIVVVLREKRDNIFTEPVNFDESFERKSFPKSEQAREHIRGGLQQNLFFAALTEAELEEMVDAMEPRDFAAGDVVIEQGDTGDNFYVVGSGTFEVLVNDVHEVDVSAPGSFGELALLYNCPRAATVRAKVASSAWALDRLTFRHALAHMAQGEFVECQRALRGNDQLSQLTDGQITTLASAVKLVHFPAGATIISKGEEGNVFYVIKSGSVRVSELADSEDATLAAGDYFGERALMTNEPRVATITAEEDVWVMALDRASFNELLGSLADVLQRNMNIRLLASVGVLSCLDDSHRAELVGALREASFEAGADIITAGEPGQSFFILKSGTAKCYKVAPGKADEEVAAYAAGSYFGEMALLSGEPRTATVRAESDVTCFVLDRDHFESTIGSLQALTERAEERRAQTQDHGRLHITMDDLEMIQSLGQGTFGLVKLCKYLPDGRPVALKVLQRQMIVEYGQQTNVMNEKNVMAESDHPFILKLLSTFKDPHRLYMVLELVQGGELFTFLHVTNPSGKQYVSSDAARFYSGCVVLGFQYIHSKSIVYRDLKPENLMLDAQGYVKIVDFGFAKVVTDRTYTLCGTPEYLAPELVLGKGHNKGVDYWALGVLIYEMLCGYSPFADPVNCDEMVICKNIVRGEYSWPRHVRDQEGKDLVRALLTRDINQRLGCLRGGAQDIRNHAWYAQFDFNALLARTLDAPWTPACRDAFDCSSFDEFIGSTDEEAFDTSFTDDGTWADEF